MVEKVYKSRKSNTQYIARGEKERAFLIVNGEMATNPKVQDEIVKVRKGRYDLATVEWIARQLSATF